MAKKPLDGVKVLDLTRVLAGPYCTMVLKNLGAEIIKVERPVTGDDSRAYGPYVNGESMYFTSINRGKKSITIDLKRSKRSIPRSSMQPCPVLAILAPIPNVLPTT